MKSLTNLFFSLLTIIVVVGCSTRLGIIKGTVVMQTANESHVRLGYL